jgi:hypothetical protein
VKERASDVATPAPGASERAALGVGQIGEMRVASWCSQARVVEFMAADRASCRTERRVGAKPRLAIAEMELAVRKARRVAEKRRHGMDNPVGVLKAVAQHHIAAAFAMDRAGCGERPEALAEAPCAGKRCGMKLRITSGEPAGIARIGRRLIGKRGEGDDLGPGTPPTGQDMRIDEGESRVGCERDPPARGWQRGNASPRRNAERRRRGHDPVEIEMTFGHFGEMAQPLRKVAMLAGLDQAEMALRQRQRGIARDRAEEADAECRNGIAGERVMTRTAYTVEDHAGDAHRRVMGGKAAYHGGGGLRLPGNIQHEQHRETEACRKVGGRAGRRESPGAPAVCAPSNRPMTPSIRRNSAPSAASPASVSRSVGGIAQLSRLTLGAPVAAA